MMQILIFTILGYLSGSVLYARIWSRVFHKNDMIEKVQIKIRVWQMRFNMVDFGVDV